MKDHYNKWLEAFTEFINDEDFENAVNYLTDKFEIPFSKPSLYEVHNAASRIPNQYYEKNFSKLLLGWLCFACGDNKGVGLVLTSINEFELETTDDCSFFYALKAMTTFLVSKEESLRYAKLALDVLPKETKNLIAGNAYMTYARLITNINKYGEGAECFDKAYDIFRRLGNTFLSVNCFVSKSLNLYAIGQIEKVISNCQEVLMFSSSKNTKMDDYLSIINLPMGMCYYQMNKVSLAIKSLNAARLAIVDTKLVHMHGLLEQYLFECYRIMNDYNKMNETIESLELVFQNLHYPQIKYLLSSMRIKYLLDLEKTPKEEWVEELELAYQLNDENTPRYIFETLTELVLKGYSKIITKDILAERLEKFRLEGQILDIQSTSLYLAEFLCREKDFDALKIHLKCSYDIYKQQGIFAPFIDRKLSCFAYLEDIDPLVVKEMNKTIAKGEIAQRLDIALNNNITNREQEIIQLMAIGKSNREISETLFISIGTTKWHINNIYSKLEVKKRFHAIEKARKLNIV